MQTLKLAGTAASYTPLFQGPDFLARRRCPDNLWRFWSYTSLFYSVTGSLTHMEWTSVVTCAHGRRSLGHIEAKWGHGDIGKIWRPYGFTRKRLAWGGHGNKTTCQQWTAAEAEAATSTGDNIPRHKRTTVTCTSDPRSCPGRSGTWGSGLASACPNIASWSLQYPSLHHMKGVQMHFALRKSWKNSTKHWSNCLWWEIVPSDSSPSKNSRHWSEPLGRLDW